VSIVEIFDIPSGARRSGMYFKVIVITQVKDNHRT
jgi:hypothetical protein